MADCTQNLDPLKLVREGTSQGQRLPEALKAFYAQVDEHEPADWMVFAKRYAEYVCFFDINKQVVGDWRPFFENDPLAILALAAVQKIDVYKSNLSQYFKFLLTKKITDSDSGELRSATDDELKTNFGHLFNAIGTLAWQLEQLKEVLPEEITLKSILKNTIRSQLAPAFARLIGYYKAAEPEGHLIIVSSDNYGWDIFGAEIGPFPLLYKKNFSLDWFPQADSTTWAEFHDLINPDDSIFGGGLLDSVSEKLNYAAAHNLFSGVFDQFVKAYARTVAEAKKNLENTFTDNAAYEGKADHKPHYTLFLAFLRLLEYARDHINGLTTKHLDFYYEKVLQLKEKLAEPNYAHLIFQLAKHNESHQLKAGIAFKAGKDSEGKDVVYELDQDFEPNIARVAELRSVYHTLSETAPALYAFPVANSDNGRGAELTSPDKQWHPFLGKTEPENLAQVGFAISSHYLLLSEGDRKIRLTLNFINTERFSRLTDISEAFDFFLSGEKGWITPAKIGLSVSSNRSQLQILLELDGSQPPVVPLQTKIHGEGLPEGLPALRAVLKQDVEARLVNLQNLQLDPASCELAVAVGYKEFNDVKPSDDRTGLKNLSLYNQFGEVNPSQPFQPFGPSPMTGDYLIIGCDEVFQKKNARFQFTVVWKGLPDWRGDIDLDWVNEFFPNVSLTLLKNGIWNLKKPDQPDVQVFFATRPDIYFPSQKMHLPDDGASEIHFDHLPYTLDRRNGFLRMTLLADFGHKLYQPTLTKYLMRVARNPSFVDEDRGKLRDEVYKKVGDKYVPKNKYKFTEEFIEHFSKARPIEPYTPVIESLTLSYIASVKLGEEKTRMYWLTPFGYKAADLSKPTISLLPEYSFEGEVYLGVKDLKPPQNLSLLFQMAEGSSNPTVKKPEAHVQWSYLRDNEWVDFKETELSDATGQLTRSGIIRYSIPNDATKDDTLFLPTGCCWLRGAVKERPDAVSKIITITAQAARVTFKDQKNAPDFLSAQLPAGTITKLVVPDAAVKKIEQPYPTFGGRPKEAEEAYYTRVSERLRHKKRAISAWDYERLILEEFPHIHKAKCLNHTRFEPDDKGGSHTYNELAAGHVTIITIPNLRNNNAIDPLKPYTNLGDLDLIKKFLEKHVSCFVKLHVRNPIFEVVRVAFRVKFLPGKDKAFHTQILQQELARFLSPWAFDEGKDVTFGGKIYKSSLIDFVEEQSYVDYVTDFQLYQPKNNRDGNDLEEAEASTAISILVSAAAEKHSVEAISESETAVQDVKCKC
jgi:hypothetical protein